MKTKEEELKKEAKKLKNNPIIQYTRGFEDGFKEGRTQALAEIKEKIEKVFKEDVEETRSVVNMEYKEQQVWIGAVLQYKDKLLSQIDEEVGK